MSTAVAVCPFLMPLLRNKDATYKSKATDDDWLVEEIKKQN